MSMYANYYTIVGYDLTRYESEKYRDWIYDDEKEYERFTCNQSVGNIQLFDDPSSRCHLFLGYIISNYDKYDNCDKTYEITFEEVYWKLEDIMNVLDNLIDIGVVSKEAEEQQIGIHSFVEYR